MELFLLSGFLSAHDTSEFVFCIVNIDGLIFLEDSCLLFRRIVVEDVELRLDAQVVRRELGAREVDFFGNVGVAGHFEEVRDAHAGRRVVDVVEVAFGAVELHGAFGMRVLHDLRELIAAIVVFVVEHVRGLELPLDRLHLVVIILDILLHERKSLLSVRMFLVVFRQAVRNLVFFIVDQMGQRACGRGIEIST